MRASSPPSVQVTLKPTKVQRLRLDLALFGDAVTCAAKVRSQPFHSELTAVADLDRVRIEIRDRAGWGVDELWVGGCCFCVDPSHAAAILKFIADAQQRAKQAA